MASAVSSPVRDDDGFVYGGIDEEEGDFELPPDDEDDVQALVRALARATGGGGSSAAASSAPAWRSDGAGGLAPSTELVPSPVDDFIRNFLIRARMSRALDAFNSEFYELKARGALPGEDMLRVPDAYSANSRLEGEVARLRVELASSQEVAGRAQATWDRFRRERDFHRMHHKRVVHEKNRLIVDIKRLKAHYEQFEPTIEELKVKYELAMKEKMLMRLEK